MTSNSARATYQHQSTIHRRTRGAIMEAAKSLLADKGISGTNMIEIADRAQVSRASTSVQPTLIVAYGEHGTPPPEPAMCTERHTKRT